MTLNAQVTYTATQDQTTFAIPFEFLNETHIHVDLGQVETTDITVTGTNVNVLSPSIATGSIVKVYRVTPTGDAGRLVDWSTGASITESNLDTSLLQDLYVAEEALDQATISLKRIGAGETAHWDAQGKKVTNAIKGSEPEDLVTKAQLDAAEIEDGNLPTVDISDNGKMLAVVGAVWATQSQSQVATILGLAKIAAGIYTWNPSGGQQSSFNPNTGATWERQQDNRMGHLGVPSAPTLTLVNDNGTIFSRAPGGGANLDIDILVDGEYLVMVTIGVHNSEVANEQLFAWAITDEQNDSGQQVFFIDEVTSSINQVQAQASFMRMKFFALTVSGGQQIAFRGANRQVSNQGNGLGWGKSTQIIVVKIG